ncbi:MAG: hypothetical protein ACK518_03905, partial [bacterium]
GIGAAALYGQNKALQRDVLGQMKMTPEQINAFGSVNGEQLNLEAVGNMNSRQYNQFLKSLKPTQQAALFQSDFFQQNYKPNPFDFVK